MKRALVSIIVVAVVALALGTAGFVYAQSTIPPTPVPGAGNGYGMGMNGRGMRGQFADADLNGPMHNEMVAAFAAKLGISVEDLNARLTNGETMAQLATSKGLTAEQFTALMVDARAQALDQAVKNGTLTQAQADAMKQRGGLMGQGQLARGTGAGMGAGRGGMMGQGMRGGMMGQGQSANPNCPFATTEQ